MKPRTITDRLRIIGSRIHTCKLGMKHARAQKNAQHIIPAHWTDGKPTTEQLRIWLCQIRRGEKEERQYSRQLARYERLRDRILTFHEDVKEALFT